MIQEHIYKLLFDHDCVIIPDFGGLITHYESARIHPVKHTFLPPSKRVAFNEKLKLNDGLLISTFAYDKRITAEEAQSQVSEFVRQLQEELNATQRFELRGVGLFRLNAEQKIEFEYIQSSNFLNDSFGLPELLSKPVLPADAAAGLRTLLKEKQENAQVTTAKPSLRRKVRRLYDTVAVMAISGLSISALYFISLQTDYNLSSLNPASLLDQKFISAEPAAPAPATEFVRERLPQTEINTSEATESQVKEAEEPPVKVEEKTIPAAPAKPTGVAETKVPAPAPTVVKAAPKATAPVTAPTKAAVAEPIKKVTEETINGATGRYYIIAGGFSTLQNAERSRKAIAAQSGQARIILPSATGTLHRVSVTDFASAEEAKAQLPALRKKFGPNLWILNF